MKIIENNYIARTIFRLTQKDKTLTNVEPEQPRAVEVYRPVFYDYFPNINFEGKSVRRMRLNEQALEPLFRGRDIIDKLTEIGQRYGKDFASFKTELIQKLTPTLRQQELQVARMDIPRFSDMVYAGLSPLIASHLCYLELANTPDIAKYFNTNNAINLADWDLDTFKMFAILELDYATNLARFREVKSNNPSLPLSTVAWCVKLNLSDEKIQTFIQEKQNNYDILDEELLYCISNGLSSVASSKYPNGSIARYVELRHREYNYLYDNTVRGQGGKFFYSVGFAMTYTLDGLSNNDVEVIEQGMMLRQYKVSKTPSLGMLSALMKSEGGLGSPRMYHSLWEIADVHGLIPQKQKIAVAPNGEKVLLTRHAKARYAVPILTDFTDMTNGSLSNVNKANSPLICKLTDFTELHKFKKMPTLPKLLGITEMFKRQPGKPSSYFAFTKDEQRIIDKWYLLQKMPNLKSVLPMDAWYNAHANTDEKTFKVLNKCVEDFLGVNKTTTGISNADIDIKSAVRNITKPQAGIVVYPASELEFDQSSSILKYKGNESFEVKVVATTIEGSHAVLFLDDDRAYVAYKGGIVQIKEPFVVNSATGESLKPYATIDRDKQKKALIDAVKYFPVNILDDDGKVVIGQGLTGVSSYKGSKKDTESTKDYYGGLFASLRANGDLNMENILRIIPIDANISINPCITDGGNILYSISSEWTDSEGTAWELRVHSADLIYNDGDAKWITRCGYRQATASDTKYLFEDNQGVINGDFNGTYNGKDSHIRIDTPIEDEDSLLKNIHFLNIAHQISLNIEEVDLLKKLCSNMSIAYYNGDTYRNIRTILEKAFENPTMYAQNKLEIDEVRRLYGYIEV